LPTEPPLEPNLSPEPQECHFCLLHVLLFVYFLTIFALLYFSCRQPKIATACLLKALESQYCIAKEAVLVEFSKIEASIQEGGTLVSDGFFDRFIGAHCEHTIVCHPVGYHNDVFKNGHTNNMENWVVLEYKQHSRPNQNF
jgi:hypothetical protein